jgi:predicted HicB family RNase H-like nuclease
VQREEYTTKTFRIENKLLERMEKVSSEHNISLNKLVAQCIEYALNDMDEDSKK